MRVFQADMVDGKELIKDDAIVVVCESQEEYDGYIHGTGEWGYELAPYGLEDRDVDFFCGEGIWAQLEVGQSVAGDLAEYYLTREIEKEEDETV